MKKNVVMFIGGVVLSFVLGFGAARATNNEVVVFDQEETWKVLEYADEFNAEAIGMKIVYENGNKYVMIRENGKQVLYEVTNK